MSPCAIGGVCSPLYVRTCTKCPGFAYAKHQRKRRNASHANDIKDKRVTATGQRCTATCCASFAGWVIDDAGSVFSLCDVMAAMLSR